MIAKIIDLLQSKDWIEIKSETIEIAKGKHELASTFKIAKRKIKRQWQLRKL